MKRSLTVAAVVLLVLTPMAAALEQFQQRGTATDVAATVSFEDKHGRVLRPFGIVVVNRDTANDLWVRADGLTATAADPSIRVPAGERLKIECDSLRDTCPSSLSLIAAAGLTAVYQVVATR